MNNDIKKKLDELEVRIGRIELLVDDGYTHRCPICGRGLLRLGHNQKDRCDECYSEVRQQGNGFFIETIASDYEI